MSDSGPGNVLRLVAEVRDVNTAFSNVGTDSTTGLSSGAVGSISVLAVALVSYHWQVRVCDQTNRCSAWVAFGGNRDLPLPADTDYQGSLVANSLQPAQSNRPP